MSGVLQRLLEVQQTTSALPAADTDSDEDRAGLRGSWSRSTCLRLALRHQAFQLRATASAMILGFAWGCNVWRLEAGSSED
jgi:hypothetical protein